MSSEPGNTSHDDSRTDWSITQSVREENQPIRDEAPATPRCSPIAFTHGVSEQTYEAIATRVLRSDERFHWLFESTGDARLRRALLIELGRLPDEHLLREAATVLCEERPDADRAITMVRQLNQGLPKSSSSALELANIMVKSAEPYLTKHPDTSDATIAEALRTATQVLIRSRSNRMTEAS